ncbi:MAG: nuclear transport factor 2 family protein [Acidimicrobiia bacterium]|nr:nuclear transport factor 2 family protein [Acidimicrobiia bacterium]
MDTEATILEQLQRQLCAALDTYYANSDPAPYVAQYADRFTTFDPWSNGRKDDSDAAAYTLSSAGGIPPFRYEVLRPRVDLIGDAAVFTFNVAMFDPATNERAGVWNATHVHDLAKDDLPLVHTHWSFAEPPQPTAT